jgi:hypothetical protein
MGKGQVRKRNRRIRSSQGGTKEMNLPLTLELTEPVILADDLNTEIRAHMCSATSSRQQSKTFNALGIIQVDAADVQVDDIIA